VWTQIKKATDSILDSITLRDMVERWRLTGMPEVPEEVV
jgi:DNA-binding IscR family transcriptional regulator